MYGFIDGWMDLYCLLVASQSASLLAVHAELAASVHPLSRVGCERHGAAAGPLRVYPQAPQWTPSPADSSSEGPHPCVIPRGETS